MTEEIFHSPNFKKSLGYSDDYEVSYEEVLKMINPQDVLSGKALINSLIARKSEEKFAGYVTYTTKDKKELKVFRTGSIFYKDNKPLVVLGTHKIVSMDDK